MNTKKSGAIKVLTWRDKINYAVWNFIHGDGLRDCSLFLNLTFIFAIIDLHTGNHFGTENVIKICVEMFRHLF